MQESLFSMEAEEFDEPAVEGKNKITRSETSKVETIDNAVGIFVSVGIGELQKVKTA